METTLSDPSKWVGLYGNYLYRYTILRVKNPAAAEDIVQETLLSALQSKERFENRSLEKTWLVGILKHKIIDYFRKNLREIPLEDLDLLGNKLDNAFDVKGHWKQGPSKWETDPVRIIEQNEFFETFKLCLSGLSEKLLAVFILKEFEDIKSEDICKELNISATNYWTMLHRARQSLRNCLDKNWFGAKREKK